MNGKNCQKLLAVAVLASSCASCSTGDNEGEQFLAARQLVVDGKFDRAIVQLEAFVTENSDSKFSSRAGLFLGKAHLAKDHMPMARKWFQWTIDNHGQTLEGHKCRYKLALCDILDKRYDEADKRFATLASKPDGPLVAEATAWRRWLPERSAEAPAGQDE